MFQRLADQLKNLQIPFAENFHDALAETDHVVDAIFGQLIIKKIAFRTALMFLAGFSFAGEVREPFPSVIEAMRKTSLPVTSVDAPSSWNIEDGPPKSGPGEGFYPEALISLTAPKPLVKWFKGRHFVGGRYVEPPSCDYVMLTQAHRFVTPGIARKYELEVPDYEGVDQVVELGQDGQKL